VNDLVDREAEFQQLPSVFCCGLTDFRWGRSSARGTRYLATVQGLRRLLHPKGPDELIQEKRDAILKLLRGCLTRWPQRHLRTAAFYQRIAIVREKNVHHDTRPWCERRSKSDTKRRRVFFEHACCLTLFGGKPRSGVKGKRSLAKRTLDVAKGSGGVRSHGSGFSPPFSVAFTPPTTPGRLTPAFLRNGPSALPGASDSRDICLSTRRSRSLS
jgi:hypothetical protein